MSYPAINEQLGKAGGAIMIRIHRMVHGIVGFGGRFVAAVPKKVAPPPAQPGPRSATST